MALINIKQSGSGTDAEMNGGVPTRGVRKWTVLFSDMTASDQDALHAAGLPAAGASYDGTYTDLIARTFSAKRIKLSAMFEVTVTYLTADSTLLGSRGISPLDRPIVLGLSGRGSSQQIDTDSAGNIIQNSANQTIKTSIQWQDPTITITRNEATYDEKTAYWNKTNNATWRGKGIGAVLLTHVGVAHQEEEFEGAMISYYVHTYNFLLLLQRFSAAPATWDRRFLDSGTVELVDGKQTVPTDAKTGRPIPAPFNLDGAGARIEAGASTPAVWFTKSLYLSATFADLDTSYSGDRLLTATP